MANKPIDPAPYVDAVGEVVRNIKPPLATLAQREKEIASKQDPSLPTSSLSSGAKQTDKATKALIAVEGLEKVNTEVAQEISNRKQVKQEQTQTQQNQGPRR